MSDAWASQCKKCKSTDVASFQQQTRSADEPMTKWAARAPPPAAARAASALTRAPAQLLHLLQLRFPLEVFLVREAWCCCERAR